jgi:NADPH-dependent ferric siderophore reductase
MRDYTPRRYDPAKGQLLFDFVIHGEGPATTWAASAAPGQLLGVGGPRGSFIIPTELDWHLLVGDESALPAIGRRLEELPANTRALVIAEVDSEAEKLALRSAAKLDVVWVYRHGKGSGSPEPLVQALREAHFPSGQYFAWAAAESHVARAVRRYLIDERGVDRHWIKAAGYWQRGAAGAHDKIED